MKRIISSRAKAGLALLGGGALLAGGWAFTNRKPEMLNSSSPVKNYLKKHFVTADSFTHSVVDNQYRKPPIPWDQNWDKYETTK